MLRLLPGVSSSLISILLVHSPAFLSKTSPDFSCVGCSQHLVLCMPAEWYRLPCWMQVTVLSARGIYIGSKIITYDMMTWELYNLEIELSLYSALMQFFVVDCAQSTNELTNCLSARRFSRTSHSWSLRERQAQKVAMVDHLRGMCGRWDNI